MGKTDINRRRNWLIENRNFVAFASKFLERFQKVAVIDNSDLYLNSLDLRLNIIDMEDYESSLPSHYLSRPDFIPPMEAAHPASSMIVSNIFDLIEDSHSLVVNLAKFKANSIIGRLRLDFCKTQGVYPLDEKKIRGLASMIGYEVVKTAVDMNKLYFVMRRTDKAKDKILYRQVKGKPIQDFPEDLPQFTSNFQRRAKLHLIKKSSHSPCSQTAIVFPARITNEIYSEGGTRIRNLKFAIDYYSKFFDQIVLVESDAKSNIDIENKKMTHILIETEDAFCKSQCNNIALKYIDQNTSCRSICFCDADLITSVEVIKAGLKQIELCPVVKPYSSLRHLDKLESMRLVANARPDEDWISNNKFPAILGGGIFFAQIEVVKGIGGWDERFSGWGGEDNAISESIVSQYKGNIHIINSLAYHLYHYDNKVDKRKHKDYNNNMSILKSIRKDPARYVREMKKNYNSSKLVFQKKTDKIIVLGSGLTAPLIKHIDTSDWKVIAINNAWRQGCWDDIIYPCDYKTLPDDEGEIYKNLIPHKIYNTANNRFGDEIKDRGDTMSMNAAYYALSLNPRVIAFLGVDMTYNKDNNGNTHCYGIGSPDPLTRLGEKNLDLFIERFDKVAKKNGVELYNLSPVEQPSRLPFQRHDIDKLKEL